MNWFIIHFTCNEYSWSLRCVWNHIFCVNWICNNLRLFWKLNKVLETVHHHDYSWLQIFWRSFMFCTIWMWEVNLLLFSTLMFLFTVTFFFIPLGYQKSTLDFIDTLFNDIDQIVERKNVWMNCNHQTCNVIILNTSEVISTGMQ